MNDRPAGVPEVHDSQPHRSGSCDPSARFNMDGSKYLVTWLLEPLKQAMSALDLQAATSILHSMTRLSDNEDGLLTDIGAIDNLGGERTLRRAAARGRKHGHKDMTTRPMDRPMSVEGVGNGSQMAKNIATIVTCTPDHEIGTYESPMIEDSDLPMLWGLRSIAAKRGLIDTYNKRIYMVGQGGYKLQCSPGTKHFEMETAPSGHLMIPNTCWDRPANGQRVESETKPIYPGTVMDAGDPWWSPESPDSY